MTSRKTLLLVNLNDIFNALLGSHRSTDVIGILKEYSDVTEIPSKASSRMVGLL